MQKEVNILGSKWIIKWVSESELDKYPALNKCEGYADKSIQTIIVQDQNVYEFDEISIKNIVKHCNKILRHEIIHAFLIESGIDDCYHTDNWGHDEIMIDWMAIQFPKINKVFKELNICD